MRQLLNSLFVTSEDIYLSLDGENVVANRGGEAVARYPLHTLQSIVSFAYSGASPALMRAENFLHGSQGRCREMSCCGECSTARQTTQFRVVALPET